MDETVRENQSDTAGGCGRRLKNSYRRYISKCYGKRKENKNFNTLIVKKKKKEVDSGNVTDNVDANTIDDFVVQQPSYGWDAFNNRFVSNLKKIEAFGSS